MNPSDSSSSAKKRPDWSKLFIILALLAVAVYLVIRFMPWVISLKDEAGREATREFIAQQGGWGVLILLGVQFLQVIVAIIPGEPIELLAGLLYGEWWGFLICMTGMLLGTVTVYYLVKWLGAPLIRRFFGEDGLSKYRFLQDGRRLRAITFLLFFIPGTPKDLLTYFMPLTAIRPVELFTLITLARIPSVLTSTFAGKFIINGNWTGTVILFAVMGGLGLTGILVNEWVVKRLEQKKEGAKHG